MAGKQNNPFADFERITAEIEDMFFRFYGGPRLRIMKGGAFQPLADVFYVKSSHQVIVKLEIPGIIPADVKLTVEDKTLVIEGARQDLGHNGEKIYQQMEIDYGNFYRKIVLPVTVDVQKSRANYEDGFLTIVLPVTEKPVAAIKLPINIREK